MFRKVISICLLACLISSGCRPNIYVPPAPPAPPPIPVPSPGPSPVVPDVDIDPNSPEKNIGFNVTLIQMEKDIIGKWITLDSSRRWFFSQGDFINLDNNGLEKPVVLSNNEVIVNTRIMSISPKSPGVKLSGTIKLRYEQVDGKWSLTEVIRTSLSVN